MANRRLVRILCAVALAVFLAPTASGELAAWDQARVTAFAKDLATTTDALYETFTQQPQPDPDPCRAGPTINSSIGCGCYASRRVCSSSRWKRATDANRRCGRHELRMLERA
jgi:hypothetical protein